MDDTLAEKQKRRRRSREVEEGLSSPGEGSQSVARKEGMKLLEGRCSEGRIECAEGGESRAGIASAQQAATRV